MSCKYCKELGSEWIVASNCNLTIDLPNELVIDYNFNLGCSGNDYIKINYCPMCGRKLREDKTDGREELIQELTSASNFLCETALLFTNPTHAETYPEWSGVYSIGEALGEVVKQLESEVAVDEAD